MIQRILKTPESQSFFLFGPRQTGKSTFLRTETSDDHTLQITLLESDTFRRYAANPELFRKEVATAVKKDAITRVIVDEIQKIPELLDEVHLLIETLPYIQFCLSGSSARKLKRSHANLLAGRAATRRMHPFTVQELGVDFDLDRALRFGTLPPIWMAENDQMRIDILESYCETYLKEEIEIEAQVRNLGGFLRFLPLLAAENGQTMNLSNVARETMLSLALVKSYYQIMEDTLLGFLLLSYTGSTRKKIARHPKFYLFDTGVKHAFEHKIKNQLVEKTSEYGRAFEHFIILEIMRLNDYLRLDCELSYYRTESGVEVDCIIKHPSGTETAVEIKATDAPSSVHCRALHSFHEEKPASQLFLVCKTQRASEIGIVKVIPWQKFLSQFVLLIEKANP
jgi:predicted AAA+ superfamily ATPase